MSGGGTVASRVVLLGSLNATTGVLTGVTTGTSIAIQPRDHEKLTVYVIGSGTISGGTVLIEEADFSDGSTAEVRDYGGTWALLGTVTASGATGGAQLATHFSPNTYGYVRVRISANITGGGTVAVTMRYS